MPDYLGLHEQANGQWYGVSVIATIVRVRDLCDRVDHPRAGIDLPFDTYYPTVPTVAATGKIGEESYIRALRLQLSATKINW